MRINARVLMLACFALLCKEMTGRRGACCVRVFMDYSSRCLHVGGRFWVTNAAQCSLHNCLPGIWQIETQFGTASISGRGNI